MQRKGRVWSRLALVALASFAGSTDCKSQQVFQPSACGDPCCHGNAAAIDCGEHPNLACTESGGACIARAYGCTNGEYYVAAAPVGGDTCATRDASFTTDGESGRFEGLDAETPATDGAIDSPSGLSDDAHADGSGTVDGPSDSTPDAGVACAPDADTDACATP